MVTLGLAAVTASAGAQGAAANTNCTGLTADACQQVVDLFYYMVPQLGTGLAGGNTTLAQGGNMGGRTLGLMPKFAIDVRINAVMGNIPVLVQPVVTLPGATAPPAKRAFATSASLVALPAFDVAIGVFKGIPVGVSSAAYVPTVDLDKISVTPDSPFKFGYGFRVGLLKESLVAPGVGFSFIQRALPKTTITGIAGSGVTATSVAIKDLDLKATSWRLTVSKSLLLFGLAAGVGQDKNSASTAITIAAPSPVPVKSFTGLTQDVTRTNYFVDVSMNLVILKIVATGGMVSGGDIFTYNTFDTAPDKSRTYASVGVRFGL
jgi:hypothetical protein